MMIMTIAGKVSFLSPSKRGKNKETKKAKLDTAAIEVMNLVRGCEK